MSDDLVELRARYTGSGSVMVCRHPDVEDLDANHEDRRCVLDLDRQDDCDIAMHYRHERKEQCACWQAMHRIAPVQPTADEALALLDRLESLTTENAALKEARDQYAGLYADRVGQLNAALAEIAALKERVQEAEKEAAAMWRNGITNTTVIVDQVRAKHREMCKRTKSIAAFDEDLDAALDAWFKATRSASPASYEGAERVFKDLQENPDA